MAFAPKPVQKPHPPIWTGGESPAALRRAGRLANTWYPIGTNPRFPVGNASAVRRIRGQSQALRQGGRTRSGLPGLCLQRELAQRPGGPDATRWPAPPLTGTPQQIADDIKRYEELGVRHMMVNLQGETQAQTLERMQRFADRIMPPTA